MASSVSIAMPPSRWLPLWSILEMDLKQTVKGWLYRLSLLVVLIISVGVLLNRAAVHREALRADGSAPAARDARAALPAQPRARSQGRAARRGHDVAAPRDAHDPARANAVDSG